MSAQKHTPEPWGAVSLAFYATREGRKTMLGQLGVSADRWVGPYESEANVSRLVACVNACAGMDDPAAEVARLKVWDEATLRAQNIDLRRQRDELLAALKGVIRVADRKTDEFDAAHAAAANAERGHLKVSTTEDKKS